MSRGRMPLSSNQVLQKLTNMTVNLLLSRADMARGIDLDPEGRNLDKDCGYIIGEPSLATYRHCYERIGIATRAIQIYPEETWAVYPSLYETEDSRITAFERIWNKFCFKHNPWHYLQRVDELSRVGRFGVLLYGFNDNKTLDQPVDGINIRGEKAVGRKQKKPLDLNYIQTFPEYLVRVMEIDTDINSPRCGQPTIYSIQMTAPNVDVAITDGSSVANTEVHWSRILHVADNRGTSNAFGTPTLRPILNQVFDARKVLGASGEMIWRGGFPGISLEAFPELAGSAELDTESAKKELEAYQNGFQRYLRLVGMTAKSLATQVADPTNHLTQYLLFICATLGVPLRIFLGSESGHLASTQDSVLWNRKLTKRQLYYLNPMVIKPFVDRLIILGILPPLEEYIIEWRDLNVLSRSDRAKITLQKTQAILQYVTSGAYALIPPRQFLTLVCEFTEDETDAIIRSAGGEDAIRKNMKLLITATAGNTPASSGTNPQNKTGAGGKRNGLGKGR